MSTDDNGGPAFPAEIGPTPSGAFQSGPFRLHCPGMTLRDYFAAEAMQELLSWEVLKTDGEVAMRAYQVADAMLKERAK